MGRPRLARVRPCGDKAEHFAGAFGKRTEHGGTHPRVTGVASGDGGECFDATEVPHFSEREGELVVDPSRRIIGHAEEARHEDRRWFG